ncbi:hypothetical protein PAMP_005257 [Pampus punctatissimus]
MLSWPSRDDPLQPMTTDKTVSVGGTVTLTCWVYESDNSSLQWSNTAQQTLYFGGKRALRDNRIQLNRSTPTELSITITEVQLSDEGEYTCSIFTMPRKGSRQGFSSHFYMCSIIPSLIFNATLLPESFRTRCTTSNTATLKIDHIFIFFIYTLVSSLYIGTSLPVRLSVCLSSGVPGKPQISGFENAVLEGDKVTLTCTSTGSKPPARLRWYRGNQELEGHTNMAESVPDGPTYNVSSELTLKLSRSDDKTLITCAVDHASLAPGDKRSEQVLRVLCESNGKWGRRLPSPIKLNERHTPFHDTHFSVRGHIPASSYMWEKKDGELPPLAKAEGAFLRFEKLNKSDNGVYVCHADNGIGISQQEYTLLVQATSPDIFSGSGSDPNYSSSPPDLFSTSTSISTSTASSPSPTPFTAEVSTTRAESSTTTLSNVLFPDLPSAPSFTTPHPSSASGTPSTATPSYSSPASSLTPSVSVRLNGVYTFTDPTAMSTSSGVDHAVIGGVVAVIVFILLCLLIVFGRYLIRHKGTYLTHEAKGSDDAPDADTAIINAEGGHSGAEDKKEYYI